MIKFRFVDHNKEDGWSDLIEVLTALKEKKCFKEHDVRVLPLTNKDDEFYAFELIVGDQYDEKKGDLTFTMEYGSDDEDEEEL